MIKSDLCLFIIGKCEFWYRARVCIRYILYRVCV
uniref:Uncharacterized protein n=1 Tax=Anguilla anguilla TaxID=7936 RepID=A0A0E9XEN6_ANGAN